MCVVSTGEGGLSNSVSASICLVDCMYVYIVYIYSMSQKEMDTSNVTCKVTYAEVSHF